MQAPNLNAITERFVKSVRDEALDHFLLFSQKQVSRIIFIGMLLDFLKDL